MAERSVIVRTAHYIWGGWGAISVLLVALAAWEWAAGFQSELILPSPLDVMAHLSQLLADPEAWRTIGITARRALLGFGLAWVVGGGLGLLAGRTITGAVISRPLISVLLGTPPIAWLVLALLWLGSGDGSPVFTVFIACLPVLFLQCMQGSRTLSLQYHDLAHNFELNARQRWVEINLPHILSYVLPATITALGVAWKVVVMAELLASDEGVGAMLAVSRSWLDTTGALAWILTTVGLLLLTEYLFLEPIKRHIERWQVRE
ncbi:ABC transporter permease [Saccharospirillum salsuginis]|uniref:ABC transporter permease n=1 Tax=Saccharospirillum salsuginis TaxID=418750 RepID=A0A918NFB0_9GAMM|nr:ABC transporter permease subunit [Saccharospirillum salsuginis]GGX66212.1 ABC transporter permease [Saccharospirillum salsuginis]